MMLGRLKYPNRSLDNWQVCMFIIGEGATGKSTIIDWARSTFMPEDVGDLTNAGQSDFGAAGIVHRVQGGWAFKPLVCIPEVKRKFGASFDQGLWQSIVTGESTAVSIKHENPPSIVPTCNIIMAGNERMQYDENKGQLSRRLIEIEFPIQLQEKDKDSLLGTRLAEETPALIVKTNRAYRAAVAKYAACGIWAKNPYWEKPGSLWADTPRILPEYYHFRRKKLNLDSDHVRGFLTHCPDLVRHADAYSPNKDIAEKFREYCTQYGIRQKTWTPTLFESAFRELKLALKKKSKPWPPGAANVSQQYVIGLGLRDHFPDLDSAAPPDGEAPEERNDWLGLLKCLESSTEEPIPLQVLLAFLQEAWVKRGHPYSEQLAVAMLDLLNPRHNRDDEAQRALLDDWDAFLDFREKRSSRRARKCE